MKVFQKYYPALVSGLIFAAVVLLFRLGWILLSQQVPSFSASNNSLLIGTGILIVVVYLCFAISIRWLAIPLYSKVTKISINRKFRIFLFEWLGFCYYFSLFCSPLLLIDAFPFLHIQGLSTLISIPKDTANTIGFLWRTAAFLIAYCVIAADHWSHLAKENPPFNQ